MNLYDLLTLSEGTTTGPSSFQVDSNVYTYATFIQTHFEYSPGTLDFRLRVYGNLLRSSYDSL